MKKALLIALAVAVAMAAVPALAEGGYSAAQKKDLLFRVMNFAVFFGILFYLVRKPLAGFFRGRRESIARNLEYLEIQARDLGEKNALVQKELEGLAAEREAILARYERQGQAEAERIVREAHEAAEAIIQKTQAAMDLEAKTAREGLRREIIELSSRAAVDLVKKNINAGDQKRLAQEFVDQVRGLKAAR